MYEKQEWCAKRHQEQERKFWWKTFGCCAHFEHEVLSGKSPPPKTTGLFDQYSWKLVWPVLAACCTASFSPLSPICKCQNQKNYKQSTKCDKTGSMQEANGVICLHGKMRYWPKLLRAVHGAAGHHDSLNQSTILRQRQETIWVAWVIYIITNGRLNLLWNESSIILERLHELMGHIPIMAPSWGELRFLPIQPILTRTYSTKSM